MNIWAKLSLACIPTALLTLTSSYKLLALFGDYGVLFMNVFLSIGMYLPILGGFLAFGARKPLQIILLALLNFSYLPILMATIMYMASP
ncbi:hypothetical protein [Priestia taiwanensis]|uniref:Uncharacterized protein n=1 Tax=Priestia taiwanensis TaxID=1347902 RepID=A0A917APU0_9BACI|nr:hypothetical protein [Priestia taiwanensis]MBM7362730.1 hypothetical protein [Priestia taiwanensis]GGE64619.1 hypothetical protein GCM10007140_13530 [Priestia taiwanensis]